METTIEITRLFGLGIGLCLAGAACLLAGIFYHMVKEGAFLYTRGGRKVIIHEAWYRVAAALVLPGILLLFLDMVI